MKMPTSTIASIESISLVIVEPLLENKRSIPSLSKAWDKVHVVTVHFLEKVVSSEFNLVVAILQYYNKVQGFFVQFHQ